MTLKIKGQEIMDKIKEIALAVWIDAITCSDNKTFEQYWEAAESQFKVFETAENSIALEALEKIAYPIKYLREEADKTGCILNGYIANQLTQESSFYQDIAHDALNKIAQQNEGKV
jgi:hypothetical protein